MNAQTWTPRDQTLYLVRWCRPNRRGPETATRLFRDLGAAQRWAEHAERHLSIEPVVILSHAVPASSWTRVGEGR